MEMIYPYDLRGNISTYYESMSRKFVYSTRHVITVTVRDIKACGQRCE